MSVGIDPLRLVRARWCLLAAAQPILAAAGAPLPFRVLVDGARPAVARYDASATAGATLALLDDDRAVLTCGDAGWRIPGAPGASGLVGRGPSWAGHPSVVDHRAVRDHYGWIAFWDGHGWSGTAGPEPGAALPPVLSTGATADALGARYADGPRSDAALVHLVRMTEYEWLDAPAWRAAFGHAGAPRLVAESWDALVGFGLTQWSGDGPVTDHVVGRSPDEARALAAEFAERSGLQIPDDVRVESAMRTRTGWEIRFLDYRDADSARPLSIRVPDVGPVAVDEHWPVH
ncbi:hypothetical protein [Tsukamurella sp. 1534]|uniref:hypothetical protein n=1 Tax=Tsukamurella sp. 1534 TaxID=1151061 RepID=UPI00031FE8FF|nr:hypothetical protein [Tsukamurella sp. 1534]